MPFPEHIHHQLLLLSNPHLRNCVPFKLQQVELLRSQRRKYNQAHHTIHWSTYYYAARLGIRAKTKTLLIILAIQLRVIIIFYFFHPHENFQLAILISRCNRRTNNWQILAGRVAVAVERCECNLGRTQTNNRIASWASPESPTTRPPHESHDQTRRHNTAAINVNAELAKRRRRDGVARRGSWLWEGWDSLFRF